MGTQLGAGAEGTHDHCSRRFLPHRESSVSRPCCFIVQSVLFFFPQQVKDKRTLKTEWQAALPDAEGSGPSAGSTGDWVFPLG